MSPLDRFWIDLLANQSGLEVLDLLSMVCDFGNDEYDLDDYAAHGVQPTTAIVRVTLNFHGMTNKHTFYSKQIGVDGSTTDSLTSIQHAVDLFDELYSQGLLDKSVSWSKEAVKIETNLQGYLYSDYLGKLIHIDGKSSRHVLTHYKAKRSLYRYVQKNFRSPIEISTDRTILVALLAAVVAFLAPIMQAITPQFTDQQSGRDTIMITIASPPVRISSTDTIGVNSTDKHADSAQLLVRPDSIPSFRMKHGTKQTQ